MDKILNFLVWKAAEIYAFGDNEDFRAITENLEELEILSDEDVSLLKERLENSELNHQGSYTLMRSYFRHIGEVYEKDLELAQELLELAVEQGNSVAALRLALLYFEGEYISSGKYTIENLIDVVLNSLSKSDVSALLGLIERGRLGNIKLGVLKNIYEKACDINIFHQIRRYAVRISNGDFGPPDPERVLQLLEYAIEKGDKDSPHVLGLMYKVGKIFPIDFQKAKKYFEIGVERESAGACYFLATLYADLQFKDYDVEKAIYWYDKAVSHGDSDACLLLAHLYVSTGTEGAEVLAYNLLVKAAELNHPVAFRILANLNSEEGCTSDQLELAKEYLDRAISLGDAEAMFNKAEHLRKGTFGSSDYDQAQIFYKKSFEGGFKDAEAFFTNPTIDLVCKKLFDSSDEREKNIEVNLRGALTRLEDKFFALREKHRISESCHLSHFTTWNTIESILKLQDDGNKDVDKKGKNCLRQYHVDYMNDPSEGNRLLNFKLDSDLHNLSRAIDVSEALKDIFNRNYFQRFNEQCVTGNLLPSVFMLSLTKDSDRLDLWRAYGADGKGFCLKLPFEKRDDKDSLKVQRNRNSSLIIYRNLYGFEDLASDLSENIESEEVVQSVDSEKNARQEIPIVYDVKYSNEEVEATLLELADHINEIFSLRLHFDERSWQMIEECICSILLELLYLYKDEQYSTEREARVLSVLNLKDERIKADERTPGHLYCETEPFLFTTPGSEVILGPKVEKKAAHLWNIRYRLTKLGFDGNTTVKESKVLYR